MRWLAALFISILMGFSTVATAFDFDSGYYGVYEAPGSGNTTIIYIVPHSMFLILASQPAVPLSFMPNTSGYQTVLYADGSLGTFTKVNYTASNMAGLNAVPSSYKLFGGDFNGDHNTDFLLQGTGNRNSVVLTTDTNGNAQIYYNFGTQLNAATYPTLNTGDVDLDGRWDIKVTNANNVSTVFYSNFAGYFDPGTPVSGDSTTTLVGAMNGKFRVDESGNSAYSVDILSAAGTAGVVPHVSLNYSSASGDGVMGSGWSIGGLSAITRCRQTLAQDNNATAITLTASDRFCLDGQRLILYSGTYGAPGSVYRTEIDSYAVITAVGGTTGNPAYFTVVRKDGSTSYYGDGSIQGNNGSTLILNGNGPALTWAISRFQDSVGNPIRFSYSTNSSTNEQLITRIDYGYGSNTTATNSSTTFLLFSYLQRPDPSSSYVAGYRIQRTQRLNIIASYNNGSELRHYPIAYRAIDSVHYQSYVQQLFECVGTNCLSPTTFNWNLNNGGFAASTNQVSISGALIGVRTMDINGDGKADIVYMTSTGSGTSTVYTVSYQLSTGNGFGSVQTLPANTITDGNTNWQVLDYNNDGKQDLLVGNSGSNWKLFLGGSSGFSSTATDVGIPYSQWAATLDLNSDGSADLITQQIGNSFSYNYLQNIAGTSNYQFDAGHQEGTGTVLQAPPPCTPTTNFVPRYGFRPLDHPTLSILSGTDFNGDGRSDIVAQQAYNAGCGLRYATVMYTNTTSNLADSQWTLTYLDYPSNTAAFPSVSDFNNDGLTDLLLLNTDATWSLKLNTGSGLTTTANLGQLGSSNSTPQLIDYDGDGYPDLIYPSSANNLVVQTYNPGSQSFSPPSAIIPTIPFQTATSTNAADQYVSVDIDGDGHPDLLRISSASTTSTITIYKSADAGGVGNRIVGIDNGLGNTTTISYKPLTDSSVYTPASDASNPTWPNVGTSKPFPVFDILAPQYVVSSVSSSAPIANATNANQVNYSATISVSYQYAGLKMQASGRGLLGFASITTTNNQSSVKQITTYRQDFPFMGQPLSVTQQTSGGLVFSNKQFTSSQISHAAADGTTYYQIYIPTTVEQTKDPVTGAEVGYVVTQTLQPNAWGNVTGSVSSPGVTSTSFISDHTTIVKQMTTYSAYGSTPYEDQFSRMSSTTVTYIRPGQPNITRSSNLTYYGSGDGALQGLLKTEQVVAGDGTASATKFYQYDQFGNKHCVSAGTDTNFATNCTPTTTNRYEIADYDSAGRYIVDKQSPFNNGSNNTWTNVITEQVISRNTFGLPTQVNGLNGLITNFTYDALGREASRKDNTGAGVTTTYARYGITGAQYNVTATTTTGAVATQYFDALGRSIAKWQKGFDGSWISSETEYDNQNRIKRQSIPHYYGATAYWQTSTYDAFRLQNQQVPATGGLTATTSMTYGTLSNLQLTTISNGLGQNRFEFRNAAGELTRVIDNNGNSIAYIYDAAGDLLQTTNTGKQNGATVTINTYLTYDQLGHKIKMQDSDKGTWFYEYDQLDQLTGQYKVTSTSNYGGTLAQAQNDSAVLMQRTYTNYDIRGRVTERFDVVQSAQYAYSIQSDATWSYDTAANGIGQVALEKQTKGGSLTRAYSYDSLGRLSSTIHNDGNAAYLLTASYDGFGRTVKTTDALGTGSGMVNNYNQYGYLQSVNDFATSAPLYSVQSMDALGNVSSALYGNLATSNWVYDQGSGLLTNQTTTNTSNVMLQRLDYTWDVLGNQKSRLDRGIQSGSTYKSLQQSFCYDGLNRLIKTAQDNSLSGACSVSAAQADQQYDDFGNIISKNNVGTYTYNSTSPHQLQSTSDGVTYTFDTAGNLTADSTGRLNYYFVFDKASVVTKGGNQILFTYGPDRNLYKRADTTSSGTTTTYYIGSVEKVIKPDGSYDMKRYIGGVALWNHHFNSSGAQTSVDQQYMYKDALGSVALITDNSGNVKQQYAFNSWGERVDNTNWQTVLASTTFLPVSQQFTTESFTGQDALDAVGLINYGGRIYDPRAGRFIQADPIIQNVTDLQAYNRYAYVRNNPLTLTDPSGFEIVYYPGGYINYGPDDVVVTGGGSISFPIMPGLTSPPAMPNVGGVDMGSVYTAMFSGNLPSGTKYKNGVLIVPGLQPIAVDVPSFYKFVNGQFVLDTTNSDYQNLMNLLNPPAPPSPASQPALMKSPSVAQGVTVAALNIQTSQPTINNSTAGLFSTLNMGGKLGAVAQGISDWWDRGLSNIESSSLTDAFDHIWQPLANESGFGILGVPAKLETTAAKSVGATGKIGENALKALGGESQVYFRTSQGGRYVDQLVNGVANESKVGYTSLTSDIRLQISKDVELMNTGQINSSTWHFFDSPVTGRGGPSGPLSDFLEQSGIGVVRH